MALFRSLEIERPGQLFMAIQRSAGNSGDLLVVDHRLAVLDDGYLSPDQSDVKALPFPGLAWQLRRRSEKAIHATRMVTRRLGGGLILHLHLVTASQIDAAI